MTNWTKTSNLVGFFNILQFIFKLYVKEFSFAFMSQKINSNSLTILFPTHFSTVFPEYSNRGSSL